MCKRLNYWITFVLVISMSGLVQADLAEWEAAISEANPLHWYKFDETGTDCIDSGSGGLNGTYEDVLLGQDGFFGPGTAAGFERNGDNRAHFTGATDLSGTWTAEYIVKTTKAPATQDAQCLHDSTTTSIRLHGWTTLGEAGFTLYGVEDYQFTPEAGLTLEDLIVQPGPWRHLVWRNDGSGIQLFFDGILVGTTDDMIDLPRLTIGGRSAATSGQLQGTLDEAVVFDRALTDIDIVNHALAASLLNPAALQASAPNPADGAFHMDTWVNLGWSPGAFGVSHDVYLSDNLDDVVNGTEAAFRGNQISPYFLVGFPGNPYPDGLLPGTTYYWRVDEINEDNPDSPWRGEIWSFSIPPKTAYQPDPADGAEVADPNSVTLRWMPGFGAILHTVYFGNDFDEVNSASMGAPSGTTSHSPGPLEREKVYYWRVDEFDALATYKGGTWTFTTPGAVGNPQPTNGAADMGMNATLSWTAADSAASHQLYLGTDKTTVRNADTAAPEYKGSVALGAESYDPGYLDADTTYYWRVDEVDNGNTAKGPVWSFTVGNYLLVEDFESYTDDDTVGEAIWQTWIDGYGIADNGAQVGYLMPPYAEQTIVHGGAQSMPLLYVNEDGVTNSEAVFTLTAPRDWTVAGVGELSLWFRGDSANAAGPLYASIANSAGAPAIAAHGDPEAAKASTWQQWAIPLQAFSDQGINLTNVDKIAIGLGDKSGMATLGGSGTMYIDDIRLYQPNP